MAEITGEIQELVGDKLPTGEDDNTTVDLVVPVGTGGAVVGEGLPYIEIQIAPGLKIIAFGAGVDSLNTLNVTQLSKTPDTVNVEIGKDILGDENDDPFDTFVMQKFTPASGEVVVLTLQA